MQDSDLCCEPLQTGTHSFGKSFSACVALSHTAQETRSVGSLSEFVSETFWMDEIEEAGAERSEDEDEDSNE